MKNLKFKFFQSTESISALENKVNDFVEGKDVIDVKLTTEYYSTQFGSNGTPTRGCVLYNVMVAYKDPTATNRETYPSSGSFPC